MQSLSSIFLGSFVIGFSGAIMPGPMLTVTIREAARRGFWAGPLVVLGHGVLEAALVVGLVLGLGSFVSRPLFLGTVGVLGGTILLWMAWTMLRGVRTLSMELEGSGSASGSGRRGGPVVGGIATSLSNPYWTLWWATVGLSYVSLTAGTGWQGPTVFFAGHILSDLVWFSGVAAVLHFGRRFLTDRVYRWLVGSCAVLLFYFGAVFLRSGLAHLGVAP
ncbi:MAG: LysE family transporter [Deferrisomatales bacterium]